MITMDSLENMPVLGYDGDIILRKLPGGSSLESEVSPDAAVPAGFSKTSCLLQGGRLISSLCRIKLWNICFVVVGPMLLKITEVIRSYTDLYC